MRDVVVVEQREDAAVLIAVEDYQVEVVDLVDEQFPRWKGDQRQFVDRRAVLLFGRAQDGEVNEIDGGVRLQQVAPCPFAGMRGARNEEHAQILAHALYDLDGAVVDRGQFAIDRPDREFEDVLAAVFEVEDIARRQIGADHHFGNYSAIEPRRDPCRSARVIADRPVIDDGEFDRQAVADKAEARGFVDFDTPVIFPLGAGDQRIERHGGRKCCGIIRDIVDLAVGDQEGSAEPARGDIADGLRQCLEGKRLGAAVLIGGGNIDHPRLNRRVFGKPRKKPFKSAFGLALPVAGQLALAAVNHHRDDCRKRRAFFAADGRIGDGGNEQQAGCPPQRGRAHPGEIARGRQRYDDGKARKDRPNRQQW